MEERPATVHAKRKREKKEKEQPRSDLNARSIPLRPSYFFRRFIRHRSSRPATFSPSHLSRCFYILSIIPLLKHTLHRAQIHDGKSALSDIVTANEVRIKLRRGTRSCANYFGNNVLFMLDGCSQRVRFVSLDNQFMHSPVGNKPSTRDSFSIYLASNIPVNTNENYIASMLQLL